MCRRILDLEVQVQRLSSIITPGEGRDTNAAEIVSGGVLAEQRTGSRTDSTPLMYEQHAPEPVTIRSDGARDPSDPSSTAFNLPPLTLDQSPIGYNTGQTVDHRRSVTSSALARPAAQSPRFLNKIFLSPTEIDSLFNV